MRYASRSSVRSFTAIVRPSGRDARMLRYSAEVCAEAVDASRTKRQAIPRMARMLARPCSVLFLHCSEPSLLIADHKAALEMDPCLIERACERRWRVAFGQAQAHRLPFHLTGHRGRPRRTFTRHAFAVLLEHAVKATTSISKLGIIEGALQLPSARHVCRSDKADRCEGCQ